jgi:hypothetical protein
MVLPVPDLNYRVAAIGDVSGDSKADVVWRNQVTGDVVVWRFNFMGSLRFGFIDAFGAAIATVDPEWHVESIGDFDGDDRSDLFWRHAPTGQTVVWLMDGFSIKGAAYGTPVDPSWSAISP